MSKILGEQEMLSLVAATPRTLVHWSQPVSEFYVVTNSDGTTTRYTAAGGASDEITKGIGRTPEPLATTNAIYTASLFNGGFTYVVSDGVNTVSYTHLTLPTKRIV